MPEGRGAAGWGRAAMFWEGRGCPGLDARVCQLFTVTVMPRLVVTTSHPFEATLWKVYVPFGTVVLFQKVSQPTSVDVAVAITWSSGCPRSAGT